MKRRKKEGGERKEKEHLNEISKIKKVKSENQKGGEKTKARSKGK